MSHASARIRHRFGRKAIISSTIVAAAVGGTVAMAQPASAASTWAGLRQCESGGNYATNTGNGFYGAYQFTLQTWQGLGYPGRPDQASPATQDAAAQKLFSQRGSQPWPVCGAGLQGSSASSGSTAVAAAPRASRSYTRSALPQQPAASSNATYRPASANTSPFFTTAIVNQIRGDVRAWQTQMNKLGYQIKIDGRYGPQSAGAAHALQAKKGLLVDGIVGPQTWRATFG